MTTVARWTAGPHRGVVWPDGAALLHASTASEVVERIWREVSDGHGDLAHFFTVLSTATGHDLLDLPGFAVALRHREVVQLAARGDFQVLVGTDAAVTVSGRDVTTWSEARVPAPAEVRLSPAENDGDASPSQFALLAGTAPVMTITAHLSAEQSSLDTAAPRLAEPGRARAPESPPTPLPLEVAPHGEADRVDEEGAPPETHDEEDAEFGHLWSEFTTLQPVEHAAVRSTEGHPASTPPAASPSSGAPAHEVTRVGNEDEDVTAVRTPKGEPRAPATHLPPPRVDGRPLRSGDHDGETVVGRRSGTASTHGEPSPTVATAKGVACPRGHANPPDQTSCRICGDVTTGGVVDLPRPSLGRLISSDGTTIELTRPVIVGREPRAARFQGTEVPQLVQLQHAHVSANHVEFRLEEWQVLARDLRSTNGTYLRRAGAEPVRMTSAPVPVSSGDQIDLGHGVLLTLESP